MLKLPPLALFASIALAACSNSKQSTPPMLALPAPPARAAEACPPLPEAPETAGEVVTWVVGVSALYADCEDRRRLAIEAWPH